MTFMLVYEANVSINARLSYVLQNVWLFALGVVDYEAQEWVVGTKSGPSGACRPAGRPECTCDTGEASQANRRCHGRVTGK
jgi:hypothetical protein